MVSNSPEGTAMCCVRESLKVVCEEEDDDEGEKQRQRMEIRVRME